MVGAHHKATNPFRTVSNTLEMPHVTHKAHGKCKPKKKTN